MVFILTTYLFLIFSTIQNSLSDVFVYNAANRLVEDFDDQPARFGPPFPSDGLKGYLMLTNPKNACTEVEPPPKIAIPGYSWIALIPRTKSNDMCDFDLKVLNAEAANFSAVIIYNYEDVLIRMSDHGRNVNIPSTLITHYDGLSLIANYLFNASVPNATDTAFFVEIDDEQIFRFGPYLIPLITVISTSFLGLIGFMLIKCCLHRRRNRRHRLPRSALKQLKTKKFTKGDRWDVCAICLDDYEEGAKLRILPCDHAYHMKCIDPWLLNNRRQCPVCKRYVFPNADDSDEESQRRATERTPLLQSNDESSVTILQRNNGNARLLVDVTPDYTTDNLNDYDGTSITDTDETSHNQRTELNNHTTYNQFNSRLTSSPEQLGYPQYPEVLLSQSSLEQSDVQERTRFDSVQESSPTPFTTPRHANFFVGSYGATTDTTNVSAHSIVEHTFGSDVDNPDEDLRFISSDQGTNQGYISDSEVTENAQNRL